MVELYVIMVHKQLVRISQQVGRDLIALLTAFATSTGGVAELLSHTRCTGRPAVLQCGLTVWRQRGLCQALSLILRIQKGLLVDQLQWGSNSTQVVHKLHRVWKLQWAQKVIPGQKLICQTLHRMC